MNGFGGILATGYLMENMGTFFHIKLWRQAMTEKLNNDRILLPAATQHRLWLKKIAYNLLSKSL